jgi:hypothetical protein
MALMAGIGEARAFAEPQSERFVGAPRTGFNVRQQVPMNDEMLII